MLLELPKHTEIFGCIKVHDVQKVLKMESDEVESELLRGFSKDELDEILHNLTVVIPIKDERMHLIDGVLRGVPKGCRIVIVSNSQRGEKDIFKMERDLVSNFYRVTKHPVSIIHQKDPGLGVAFKEVGYTCILDESGFVRNGKAEGMIVGLLLAKRFGNDYVCFVDADNYIPCSVNEYVKLYCAGFLLSNTPYSMVRLHWKYKPKVIEDRLYFRKWGRVSEITNKYLNMMLAIQTGFETSIIKTGNAGEHGMTMKLAEIMAFSTGYSIEPYQLVYLFEEFWKGETKFKEAVASGIEVFQIETLNPHIHEEKGEEHIKEMLLQSLATIYHSKLSNEKLREEIFDELKRNGVVRRKSDIKKNITMPPIASIDMKEFNKLLDEYSETFITFG